MVQSLLGEVLQREAAPGCLEGSTGRYSRPAAQRGLLVAACAFWHRIEPSAKMLQDVACWNGCVFSPFPLEDLGGKTARLRVPLPLRDACCAGTHVFYARMPWHTSVGALAEAYRLGAGVGGEQFYTQVWSQGRMVEPSEHVQDYSDLFIEVIGRAEISGCPSLEDEASMSGAED